MFHNPLKVDRPKILLTSKGRIAMTSQGRVTGGKVGELFAAHSRRQGCGNRSEGNGGIPRGIEAHLWLNSHENI